MEFYQCRKLETVMVVVFEEMQSDLRSLLPHIAKFAGLHAVGSARLFDSWLTSFFETIGAEAGGRGCGAAG